MRSFRNTFIRIAADCPETEGIEPPSRGGKKPVHAIHLDLLRKRPYFFTHEELIAEGELLREPPTGESKKEILARLRSKPLPCLRTSALAKRYGWGIHFDPHGKIAIYPAGSAEYEKLASDPTIDQAPAMRSKRDRG
jgi:hypothetical protein